MKNGILLIAVLLLSFVSTAGNRSYKRLNRLYSEDRWRCLRVAEKYIKRLPDNSDPYYFASAVYKEKSKTHGQIKTRYMMMSKSIRYATKFENLKDLDMMSRVNWGAYILELERDTKSLISDLDQENLSDLGDRLGEKCDDLMYLHESVEIPEETINIVADSGDNSSEENTQENSASPDEQAGYFGLASGQEVAPSANKIQEQELLKLINEEREALFMSPLKWDESLARAARYHANDMAQQNYLMHESYDLIDGQLILVADADRRIGQFQSKSNVYGEAIAGGTTTAKSTLLRWIGQDEEYDVLFSEDNKAVGIGLAYDPDSDYGYYWVLVVAERK